MPKINERQVLWLKKHFKHTKNDEICAKLGISTSYLHHLARQYGLKKSKQFMKKAQLNASAIGAEVVRNETGEAKARRSEIARQNAKLGHFKPGVWALRNKTAEEIAEITRKKAASWKATRQADETRLDWGLPTQTKFRFARHRYKNKRLCQLRGYMRKIGYHIPDKAGMKAYVTVDTKRSAKCEAEAIKLGMIIKEQDK